MKSVRKWLGKVARHGAPLLVLAVGVGGMYALANRKLDVKSTQEHFLEPLVRTVAVETYAGGLDSELDGVVVPYRQIELAAEVTGRVVEKSDRCRIGRFVEKGEILLRLDARDYELDVQRLERQVDQSESSLEDNRVEQVNSQALIELGNEEWELQKTELARVENLRSSLTATDVDKAKRAEWSSRNSLRTLRNQLQLLKSREKGLENARDLTRAQLEKARLDLKRTVVQAPIEGVIVEEQFEQDSYVQKGDLLLTIEDTSKVEVKSNLRIDDLSWIWQQTAHVADSSYELPPVPVSVLFRPASNGIQFRWSGVLSRFDGLGVDEKTRTVPCRIEVDNPRDVRIDGGANRSSTTFAPPALLRGMYVQLLVHLQPPNELLRVPEVAVQPGKRVLRVRHGRIEFVGPVSLAKRIDDLGRHGTEHFFLVPSSPTGLQHGDRVVSSPLVVAEPGLKVREEMSGGAGTAKASPTEPEGLEVSGPANESAPPSRS